MQQEPRQQTELLADSKEHNIIPDHQESEKGSTPYAHSFVSFDIINQYQKQHYTQERAGVYTNDWLSEQFFIPPCPQPDVQRVIN